MTLRNTLYLEGLCIIVLMIANACCCGEDPQVNTAEVTAELDRLQGEWVLTVLKIRDRYSSSFVMPTTFDGKMVIKGDAVEYSLLLQGQKEEYSYCLKLDPTKNPKYFDESIPNEGIVTGIYELTGDTLERCTTRGIDGPRTRSFEDGVYSVWNRKISHTEDTDRTSKSDRNSSLSEGVNNPSSSDKHSSNFTNSVGMKFTLISAGEFRMGNGESAAETKRIFEGKSATWFHDEFPQHPVRLSKPFYLGVHEVTQAQYERVMGANPSHFKGPRRPVETVSWEDAVEFCKTLSALPEEKTAGRVYRLPTEAEWEYACRAGTRTHFSFANAPDDLGEYAWFTENSSGTTHLVGRRSASALGLYDMHGNVWEWCADWFGEYTVPSMDDPVGPPTGSDRVIRGGSWFAPAGDCRSAVRVGMAPNSRYSVLGFRVIAVHSDAEQMIRE
jgi:uncharacterized protein (TIGR03067 family)